MQTKRKQTLLAGVGLLTALSLSMVGCTPSKFTPGVTAPTGPNAPAATSPGTPSAALTTIAGKADINGTPFANAAVKIVNLATGNVIAVGGGNLKTDAAGNFSADVSGLTENDVVRVEVSSDGKTMAALMSGGGLTTTADAPAGYAVAALSTKLTINPTSTFMAHALGNVMSLLVGSKKLDAINAAFGEASNISRDYKSRFESDPSLGERLNLVGFGEADNVNKNNLLKQIAKDVGIVQLLTNTITVAVQAAAKTNPAAVQALSNGTVSPAVEVKIEVVGNTIKIGDTVINVDTGTVDVPKADPEAPVLTVEEQKAEAEENLGVWINSGNMNPTVTIGTNSVQVSQSSGQVQMTSLTLLLPKANLTNGSLANLSGAGLSGSVTGTTQSGTARAGALTFANTSVTASVASGTVSMAGFGQIGTYTVTDQGGTWEIKMSYTFNELGVTLVGAHSTTVTATAVTLTANTGMSILIAGDGASSRVQY